MIDQNDFYPSEQQLLDAGHEIYKWCEDFTILGEDVCESCDGVIQGNQLIPELGSRCVSCETFLVGISTKCLRCGKLAHNKCFSKCSTSNYRDYPADSRVIRGVSFFACWVCRNKKLLYNEDGDVVEYE